MNSQLTHLDEPRNYYLIAPASIVRQDSTAYTYHSPNQLQVGSLVRVSVGRRLVNGVVMARIKQVPKFKTKPINQVLNNTPLPAATIKLAEWISDYYSTHLGT